MNIKYVCQTCGREWVLASEQCPSCSSPNWANQKALQPQSVAPHSRRAVDSKKLLGLCLFFARQLLDKHVLIVPESTTEMIAKEIAVSFEPELRLRTKGASPRARMNKALTHVKKLLEYCGRESANNKLRGSILARSNSLRLALSDLGVVIWLSMAIPPVRVADMLDQHSCGLPAPELAKLQQALHTALANNSKSGRPRGDTARVLRAACIAWFRAGRSEKYTWDEQSQKLKGPLSVFARDCLRVCGLPRLNDNALYCALRYALPDVEASLSRRP